jgi:transcriptional regulator with XRE-family HTH domain
MAMKPKRGHPIRELRREIGGIMQRDFARRIGISADYLKRIELGSRNLTPAIARRIQHEAGVDSRSLLKGKLRSVFAARSNAPGYTAADYKSWRKEIYSEQDDRNDRTARARALNLVPWIEILLRAAAQPQKRRLWQVWERLVQALDECREEFNLAAATDRLIDEYDPPLDSVRASDIEQLRRAGWKKKDLPRRGEQIVLVWSPGSGSLTPVWLRNIKKMS